MTNPYESPVRPPAQVARALLPRAARLSMVAAIWLTGWATSLLCFYVRVGSLPVGAAYLFVLPVMICPVALPGSTGETLRLLLQPVPAALANPVVVVAMLAFWPLNVSFLVLALRTGKLRYFALLACITVLASANWHYETVAMIMGV